MSQAPEAQDHQGRYVQANGLNIYYEEYGAGEPLILVHGGTVTTESWQPQIPAFAGQFRVLVPDSRGHGRTDNPTGSMSYRLMADDLAAFVDALGLDKPLIYGYSDGGQIALELGMRYPDLARALVVGAAWFKFTESYRQGIQAFLGGEGTDDVDTKKLEAEMPEYVELLRAWHRPGSDSDYWRTLLKQIKPMWLTPLNYTPADFQQIVAPTLILVGDRDLMVPVEEAVEMYRLMPTAELAIVPNADHFRTAENELTTTTVLDFLSRHSPHTGR